MSGFLARHTVGAWRELHELWAPRERALDLRPLAILVVAAVSLTLQYYFGDRDYFAVLWPRPVNAVWVDSDWELRSFMWWTAWRVVGYLVVPALIVAVAFRERLGDWGLGAAGFVRHLRVYALLFAVVLPAVLLVAQTESFRLQYPFYKLANRSPADLWAWEAMYAAQFLALEFFFRGFLLFGLARAVGAHAIWITVVPYVMIHFDKPVLETLGAVIAGLVLGTLALRTRSIWGGVVIHVAVALSMDLVAVRHCPAGAPCPTPEVAPWERLEYGHGPR